VNALRGWLGVELDEVSWLEKAVSVAGGFVSILVVVALSRQVLGLNGASLLIASMGASAVLLFAVPHGQLSQPWPVAAGHLGSAAIGVTCAKLIPSVEVAAAVAVGLAIGFMHQCKCIHPPGGATALTAVIGGSAVTSLGYSFVLSPVLLNTAAILVVAVVFNAPFRWRRYPAFAGRRRAPTGERPELTHEQIMGAVRMLDSFIDISEEDLARLFHILSTGTDHAPSTEVAPVTTST
jgi:CBS domain-containing membrane protein